MSPSSGREGPFAPGGALAERSLNRGCRISSHALNISFHSAGPAPALLPSRSRNRLSKAATSIQDSASPAPEASSPPEPASRGAVVLGVDR